MARKPRLEYEGALYHVISRGNARQPIFLADADYRRYLTYLGESQQRHGFRLYAYVLMTNHVHLLLETAHEPLSRIMQRLNSRYSLVFNRGHRRVGHVLQGRYQALLCEHDRYLLALTRYLHLNPVRARMVRDPAAYPWSSYHTYLGRRGPVQVETDRVLAQFGATSAAQRTGYRKFVLEAVDHGHQPEYYAAAEGRVLGDEAFVATVLKPATGTRPPRRIDASRMIEQVAQALGLSPAEVKGPGKDRPRVEARSWIAYAGSRYTSLRASELARILSVDPSCLSHAARRLERQLDQPTDRPVLTKVLERIENFIFHV